MAAAYYSCGLTTVTLTLLLSLLTNFDFFVGKLDMHLLFCDTQYDH